LKFQTKIGSNPFEISKIGSNPFEISKIGSNPFEISKIGYFDLSPGKRLQPLTRYEFILIMSTT
jgi:hypothetical protein